MCKHSYFPLSLKEPTLYCKRWRQTKECDPGGPLEQDKSCTDYIESGWSGYCECIDGEKQMEKGCKKARFQTCDEACQSGSVL